MRRISRGKLWIQRSVIPILILFSMGFRAETLSGGKIMAEHQKRHGSTSQIETIKMVTLDNRGNITTREAVRTLMLDKSGVHYSLLRMLGPEDIRGVSLLNIHEKGKNSLQYIYLPALGQVRQITGGSMKSYFLGSDFTYEDLRLKPFGEYEYERLLDEPVAGINAYRLVVVPTSKQSKSESGYSKKEMFISTDDYHLLKVDYFDKQGKSLKTLRFHDFVQTSGDGRGTHPTRMEMIHHQKNTTSMLVITKGNYNQPVPLKYFDVEALKSWTSQDYSEILSLLEN